MWRNSSTASTIVQVASANEASVTVVEVVTVACTALHCIACKQESISYKVTTTGVLPHQMNDGSTSGPDEPTHYRNLSLTYRHQIAGR